MGREPEATGVRQRRKGRSRSGEISSPSRPEIKERSPTDCLGRMRAGASPRERSGAYTGIRGPIKSLGKAMCGSDFPPSRIAPIHVQERVER